MSTSLAQAPAVERVTIAANNQAVELVPARGSKSLRIQFIGAAGQWDYNGTEGAALTDPAPAAADTYYDIPLAITSAGTRPVFVAVASGAPVVCVVVSLP